MTKNSLFIAIKEAQKLGMANDLYGKYLLLEKL